MKAEFKGGSPKGTVAAPPSKSYAHRLLIAAALAAGESQLQGVALSQDIRATLDCLSALGAKYRLEDGVLHMNGCGGRPAAAGPLLCGESGSTLRLLLPVALLGGGEIRFCGTERLMARGVGVYREILTGTGIMLTEEKNALRISGLLQPGIYRPRGDVSSQFISGLLLALPLLPADSRIEIRPPVESRSYIRLTLDVLERFGIAVLPQGENAFAVPGGQQYRPGRFAVEGDWSNAAFFYALGALGGAVEVTGLNPHSLQGDRVCLDMLAALDSPGAELDLSDCPDLGPVLFAVAAAKHGARFYGTRRLAIKESDRVQAMLAELKKFGVEGKTGDNTVEIIAKSFGPPQQPLWGHNDHRIVMALSVLAAFTGGVIEGAEAVNKSFGGFFRALRQLGLEVDYADG
ncbi:MAG: 3-phosphoshikimate 1-carboxyvinyltransferase [Firmicutes bacterium]|nr:3-phosphoshikimate 1-carboxyvinyltransferase [Bacillota bacterium]